MVNCCSALKCTNTSDVYPELIFHRFPLKNPEILEKWVIASKRKDFKPSVNSRMCSSHFQPSDYNPPVICGPPRLKKNAVPSVFDVPEHLMPKPGEKRTIMGVLVSSNCENIEEPVEENQPIVEDVKEFSTVSTQTTLTGPRLVKRLTENSKAKKLLLQKVSRQKKQIIKLREILIMLKENAAARPATPDV